MRLLTYKIQGLLYLGGNLHTKLFSKFWKVSANKTLKESVYTRLKPSSNSIFFASKILFSSSYTPTIFKVLFIMEAGKNMESIISPSVQLDRFDGTNFHSLESKVVLPS